MDKKKALRPRSISPFPAQHGFVCSEGMNGDLVMIIQIILNELHIFYDDYPYLPVTGTYCKKTAGAVREIQRMCGLSVTGIVDIETWNRMAADYNTSVKM